VGRQRGWKETCSETSTPVMPRMPAVSPKVVAIGASTGGPRTTQAILAALPAEFPCPILVVQHISLGFTRGFAQWLQRETPLKIRVLERAERLQAGTVYMAEDGSHLAVRRGMGALRADPPVNACRPSVDVLFQSVSREYGDLAIAVLLTGMGRDGARGALEVRQIGGEVIVQDEASSVIFGMPKAAIELGAATRVVSARDVPRTLAELIGGAKVARTAKGSV
jgi:two-component system chemotaxis response regulator CheB